jgi:hypothetical protein
MIRQSSISTTTWMLVFWTGLLLRCSRGIEPRSVECLSLFSLDHSAPNVPSHVHLGRNADAIFVMCHNLNSNNWLNRFSPSSRVRPMTSFSMQKAGLLSSTTLTEHPDAWSRVPAILESGCGSQTKVGPIRKRVVRIWSLISSRS